MQYDLALEHQINIFLVKKKPDGTYLDSICDETQIQNKTDVWRVGWTRDIYLIDITYETFPERASSSPTRNR